MKKLTMNLGAMAAWSFLIAAPISAFGQTTTTTTTSEGTVQQMTPDAIAVDVGTSPTPVRYTFSRTTSYVDENGNPVSIQTVRSGVPVTVYYQKEGDAFVADKVVVRKSVTTTVPETPAPAPPPAPVPAPPTEQGVVTDAGEGHIDLRTADSPRPIHYKAHDSTVYVDEGGNPLPRKMLTRGTPVTVFYEQHGDDLFATRVVIRNPAVLGQ